MRDDEVRSHSLVALRSGVASARFEKDVRDATETQRDAQDAVQTGQGELSAGEATGLPQPARPLPLIRRLGRRILRAVRPLALPFLHRFHMHVAHAVDASPAVQQQGLLLKDIRDLLAYLREEMPHALDTPESLSSRLAQQQDQLDGLRSLAIANLNALVALSAREDDTHRSTDAGNPNSVHASSDEKGESPPEKHVDAEQIDAERNLENERKTLLEGIRQLQRQQAEQRDLIERVLRSRIVPLDEEVLIRTSYGWLLVPRGDHAIITTIGEVGDALEPGTVSVIRSILQSGDLAVDVGANVGAMLLPMAERVGPEGMLIACEPSPTCMQALRKTAVLNGLEASLALHQVAVGSTDGVATLHLGSNSSLNSIIELPGAGGAMAVPIKRLDDIVPADLCPSLVKIDVEGFELEVLSGMRGIVDRSPNIALIAEYGPSHLARNGISPEEWIAKFESLGFNLWAIDEATGMLFKASVETLRSIYSTNILMVRGDLARWPQLKVAP